MLCPVKELLQKSYVHCRGSWNRKKGTFGLKSYLILDFWFVMADSFTSADSCMHKKQPIWNIVYKIIFLKAKFPAPGHSRHFPDSQVIWVNKIHHNLSGSTPSNHWLGLLIIQTAGIRAESILSQVSIWRVVIKPKHMGPEPPLLPVCAAPLKSESIRELTLVWKCWPITQCFCSNDGNITQGYKTGCKLPHMT